MSLGSLEDSSQGNVVAIEPICAIEGGFLKKAKRYDRRAVSFILFHYGKAIRKMLLSGESYTISADRTGRMSRKLVRLIVKQNKEHRNIDNLKKVKERPAFTPHLKLFFETQGGTINKRLVEVVGTKGFKRALQDIPISKRYKFPKA